MTNVLAALLAASIQVDPSAYIIERPVELEVRRDPITDQVSAFAVARADGARLGVGCDPSEYRGVRVKLAGRIWFADEKLVTGRREFVYRFGDAAPVRSQWTTDDRSATLQPRSWTANFLAWMIDSERLVMRVDDIEGREIDLFFSLAGASKAVDGMLEACRAYELRTEMLGAPA